MEDPASYDELWVDEDGYCSWWLRSPGCEAGYGANVRSNGFVYLRGDDRNIFRLGVRPAMWVSFGRIDSAIINESLHAKYEKVKKLLIVMFFYSVFFREYHVTYPLSLSDE